MEFNHHLVVSRNSGKMTAFRKDGVRLWQINCLCRGVGGRDWRRNGADTPPGVYKIGQVYNDRATDQLTPAYGWMSFDMISLERGELNIGRAGIMIHGGGTGLPNPQAPRQALLPTLGCIRVHNEDCLRIWDLVKLGEVKVTVTDV